MRRIPMMMFLIVLVILFLIDLYAFRGVLNWTSGLNPVLKWGIHILYWLPLLGVIIVSFLINGRQQTLFESNLYYNLVYPIMGLMIFNYIPKMLFGT
ncbi:MAG: hypothetical protein MI922_29250, partial [Bacteroidales bacterium]|nr:hypothetical protein [Bacteroidales bacterium]